MKHKSKIFLIGNRSILMLGIRSIIAASDNFRIVGEESVSDKLINHVIRSNPKIIIIDLIDSESILIQLIKIFNNKIKNVKVIVISISKDIRLIEGLFGLGVKGYLFYDFQAEELIDAASNVMAGNVYFGRSIAKIVVNRLISKNQIVKRKQKSVLTKRETEVLKLIAKGLKNREVADKLFIGLRTVETHRQRIMKKLNIHNTVLLLNYAMSRGIISK